ncbi:chtb [Sucra jujuba nucleopolyhedrovirus]|uniref:Chtb n=1 Tax=Sucra jujuba nucleopolyhedrovirus TaxID=1563660 RepID=A0A097P8V5_9ABAC|nr:chtb [Sucra jujuba nucleopolyhedrovirus]AIU41260.1 chtb [Sucra jujuba nucleopolyhedrovirus]
MWFLVVFFILVKLFVFHRMKNMHLGLNNDKICPKGYYGFAPDPFDCNAYYLCPDKVHLFCPPQLQFDILQYSCVTNDLIDGCVDVQTKSLLL